MQYAPNGVEDVVRGELLREAIDPTGRVAMNRSATNRLVEHWVRMFRAGGSSRWLALLIAVGLVGWAVVQAGRLSSPESRGTSSRTGWPESAGPSPAPTVPAPASPSNQPPIEPPTRPPSGEFDSTANNPSHDEPPGQLTPGPNGSLRSAAGLVYTRGSQQGHRLRHVLAHTVDEPDRPGQHGVFADADQASVVALIDEAYARSQQRHRGVRRVTEDERTILTVDMERVVGHIGGESGQRRDRPPARHLRLVLEADRVITAYPVIP